jgi:hypothetical protein
MAETAVGSAHIRLSEFLDTLPRRPCEVQPQNKHYCTICERLNRGVATRCKYSSIKDDTELDGSPSPDGPVDFIQVRDDQQPSEKLGESTGVNNADDPERVEFKIVAPLKPNDDYPMLELVQSKEKQVNPIEMELLQDVAIEFEVSDSNDGVSEDAVEVEPLEVEPLDDFEDDDEVIIDSSNGADDDTMEVEALEVEIIDEEPTTTGPGQAPTGNIPQFKPLGQAQEPKLEGETGPQKLTPSPKVSKKKIKKKSINKMKKRPILQPQKQPKLKQPKSQPQPVPQPVPQPQTQPKVQPQPIPQPQTQPKVQPQPKAQAQPPLIMKPLSQTTFQPMEKHPPKKLKKVKKK